MNHDDPVTKSWRHYDNVHVWIALITIVAILAINL